MADPGEIRVARTLNGKPSPGSGRRGFDGDVIFPKGSIWKSWVLEVKRRKSHPRRIADALNQANHALAIGDRRFPGVVLVSDEGEDDLFLGKLSDVVTFCEALAEMGQGAEVRSLIRSAKRALEEADRRAR